MQTIFVKNKVHSFFKVLFPERSLPVGNYILTLNVSMAIIPSIWRADVVNLKVVSTPLVVSILGGSGRSVGYGSKLILNSR